MARTSISGYAVVVQPAICSRPAGIPSLAADAATGREAPSSSLRGICRWRYSAPIGSLSPTLDATFFALSDPTRRGILERLGRGPATIGELARPFGLTLNGMRKHVGILELADLVVTEKVGRARECRLGPASLADATDWITAYRRAWQARLDRFGAYVEHRVEGDA